MAGHHHYRAMVVAGCFPLFQQRNPIDLGHPDIEQYQIRIHRTPDFIGGFGVFGHVDQVTLILENILEQETNVRFVIDY
jgi:hypothetical protein